MQSLNWYFSVSKLARTPKRKGPACVGAWLAVLIRPMLFQFVSWLTWAYETLYVIGESEIHWWMYTDGPIKCVAVSAIMSVSERCMHQSSLLVFSEFLIYFLTALVYYSRYDLVIFCVIALVNDFYHDFPECCGFFTARLTVMVLPSALLLQIIPVSINGLCDLLIINLELESSSFSIS